MANQMIALQARAPQAPNIGGMAAQYGNTMANLAVMKEKQAAVERANAFRQLVSDPGFDPANPEHVKLAQSLDPAGAEKIVSAADARREANLKYIGNLTQNFRDQLAVIDPNDKAAYGALREEIVKAVPGWGSRLPTADQWNADTRLRTIMKADDVISKTIATPTASVQFAPGGEAFGVTVGGMGAPRADEVIVQSRPAGDGGTATPSAAPATNAPARATRGSATTPQDLLEQGVDPNSIPSGNPLDPVAFTPGGEAMGIAAVQPLTVENAPQIIQTAIQNGVIDQSHVEQLRQMVGPENDAALAQWMRQNNVRIQPAGEPSLRSAVYRPGQDAAPQMQEAQAGTNAVGTQFRGRDPMQSPMPGTAIVPLPRVRGQAAAEEGGKQGVRVATEPVIVGASEEAKNLAELKKNLPKARGALDLAVKQLNRDLADVDYVLRNPARQMVVGVIEGRLPSFVNMFRSHGQDAQNVQSRLDKINAKSVVTHLQAMREASPQGSSLFGQVTEYEDRLVKALAGLDQAQDEPTFDLALQDYRGVIADIRQNLPRVFNETYKAVGGSASVRPLPPGGKAGPTMDDIAYLRRNITKKGVADGFLKTFGQQAFNEAIGRR